MTIVELPKGLADICRIIEAGAGLRITMPGRADNLIRFERARDDAGCANWDELARRLASEPITGQAWTAAINALTVNETYFFRNAPQMDVLRKQVLPALIEERSASDQPWLRLWSAGCATGEEAYSLAILVSELIPDLRRWRVFIQGTDLNPESLARAELGAYRAWSFRDTDPVIKARYCAPYGDLVRVTDQIRGMVSFSVLNLVDEHGWGSAAGTMDVILCRNVLMYFSRQNARLSAARLMSALRPGGWLFVGPSEPDDKVFTGFELVTLPQTTGYRRPGDPEHSAAARPATAAGDRAGLDVAKSAFDVRTRNQEPTPIQAVSFLDAARVAADAARYYEARELCLQALNANPADADACFVLANAYSGQDQPELAVTAFRKAIYLDRDFVLAHHGLSFELRTIGDDMGAERSAQIARDLVRSLPAAALLRGGDGATAGELHLLSGRDARGMSA